MNLTTTLGAAKKILDTIGRQLAQRAKDDKDGKEISIPKLDTFQIAAYDFAWKASELYAAEALAAYAEKQGPLEKNLAQLFTAEVTGNRMDEEFYRKVAGQIREKGHGGNYGLDEQHQMFHETFKRFAEDNVVPVAEKVHRHDLLIPQEIMKGLIDLGCFGLSIPQKFGGFQDDARPDNTSMAVVTEELSRGSLGVAGSLITRPEILSKAILKGGTEEKKIKWLPLLATGEKMAAVAATEPDYGSDVAGMKGAATRKESKG